MTIDQWVNFDECLSYNLGSTLCLVTRCEHGRWVNVGAVINSVV